MALFQCKLTLTTLRSKTEIESTSAREWMLYVVGNMRLSSRGLYPPTSAVPTRSLAKNDHFTSCENVVRMVVP